MAPRIASTRNESLGMHGEHIEMLHNMKIRNPIYIYIILYILYIIYIIYYILYIIYYILYIIYYILYIIYVVLYMLYYILYILYILYLLYIYTPSLKLTFSHPKMDGWNTSFLFGVA